MGKSTISMAIFHCYVKLPEGNPSEDFPGAKKKSSAWPWKTEDCKPPRGHLSALASQCLSLKDSELQQAGWLAFHGIWHWFHGILMGFHGIYIILISWDLTLMIHGGWGNGYWVMVWFALFWGRRVQRHCLSDEASERFENPQHQQFLVDSSWGKPFCRHTRTQERAEYWNSHALQHIPCTLDTNWLVVSDLYCFTIYSYLYHSIPKMTI